MPELLTLSINGTTVRVLPGTSVCAAMLSVGAHCRVSVSGEPRAALCGMGICFECRAVIDGMPHGRTCQLACAEGMRVETQP